MMLNPDYPEITESDLGELFVRVCRSCRAAALQKPNGSYLCLKCDPSVSFAEFVSIVRLWFTPIPAQLASGTARECHGETQSIQL
jgi:hypothetical protein